MKFAMRSAMSKLGRTGDRLLALALIVSTCNAVSHAQEPDMAELQKNIDIFSGVLADALDLEQATGLFGISLGGIDSTYLYGQGVLLEVRTPLSSQRNTLGLASLTSTLQAMQARGNPFATLSRSAAVNDSPPALALSANNEAEDFYRTMMERISSVDYSLHFNTAIQQASDYARSLRSLDNLDDATYDTVRNELDALREQMQEEFARLREVEEELRDAATSASTNSVAQADIRSSLDNILARLEPLRDSAVAKAEELRERSRIAEQEYAVRWQQEVVAFESNLYAAMCNYGATLHELPNDENVSVILTGLGSDTGESRRTDRVHVFSKRDLLQCQSGDIDVQILQERSTHYSY